MMKRIQACRALVLAAGLVAAGASFASAEEAAAEKPFMPTIYGGAGIGYADTHKSNFGWGVQVAARLIEHGALQVEYFNMDHQQGKAGDYDGVYFGLMPILPVGGGASLYGQVGAVVSDAGDDVAGGGGALYKLPIDFLEQNKVDLNLRLDYKYLNLDDGEHLLLFGFMLGFHK